MTDLQTFQGLLSSLAPVSGTNFQIWGNNEEILFSTMGTSTGRIERQEWQTLAGRIAQEKGFQYRTDGKSTFLCGRPLTIDGSTSAVLAFGENRVPQRKRCGAKHAHEMNDFLNNLVGLFEANLRAKEESDELAQELEQSFESLYLYGKISSQIRGLTFSNEMLRELLEDLLENMRTDAAFAWFSEKREFNTHAVTPRFSSLFSAPKSLFDSLMDLLSAEESARTEHFFLLNDSRESARYQALAVAPFRFLAVKVQHQEYLYGWLGLLSFNLNERFRQSELKLLLSLASQLAGVITNTDLYNDLEQFVINMVRSLVYAIEAKDVYTRGHSERVSKYALLMGKRLGLGKKELADLKWASILHDIGKIGIPESILNKSGKLTAAEYETIKGHPQKGAEILEPIEQLADSLPSILHHHERYDGLGYPTGLKGENIPLLARIIAVADTFDAISSTRAYRGPRGPAEALEIIEEVAGTQLDSRMVQVFKKIVKEEYMFEKEK